MIVYDSNSFFDNEVVRYVDYLLLLLILIVFPMSASVGEQEFVLSFILIIAGALFALGITAYALKKTDFFIEQMGAKEADKKVNYALIYSAIAFVLCTSFLFYLTFFIMLMVKGELSDVSIWLIVIVLLPPIILLVNLLNIGCLFYPLFDEYISY